MILSYYGRNTRVAELREQCSVGRDGLTAQAIARTAQNYGLRIKSYSLELADCQHIQLPAVVHWDFKHFVILEHWTPSQVIIVDPSLGRRKLTIDEFSDSFTGVVLTFAPTHQFKSQTTKPTFTKSHYIHQIMRTPKTLRIMFQVLAVSIILHVIGLIIPIFTKVLVDNILPSQMMDIMNILGLGLLILIITQLISSYLRAISLVYLQARLDAQLMLDFFEHLLSLPYSFFQQRSSGDLLMRLNSNTIIREILTSQTLSILLDGLLIFVYLFIIFWQMPQFGLLVLGIGLGQVAILLFSNQRMHGLVQQQLATKAESQGYLVNSLAGIATLKVEGAENQTFDKWSNLFFKELNASLQQNQLTALVNTLTSTLRTLSPLLLLWQGAHYVIDGRMSLGTMLSLNALAMIFLTPLSTVIGTLRQLQWVRAYFERLIDVLEAKPEDIGATASRMKPLAGCIELKNVSFQYSFESPLVLKDISLTIESGQKVALVGRSGSGKSTLALLLLGLYKPTTGAIYYDGQSLSKLDYRWLRRQFGVVLQDPFLFSHSIRQNITFNNPALPLARVQEAAQLAIIDEDIQQLPLGYETPVTEGGLGFSGGQRQRLCIARALAKEPSILLLDEATSHLDVETERKVYANLDTLTCTRIVIAHRLSTITNADLIIVLDNGRIIEKGTHHELLAQGQAYARLIHNQLEADNDVAYGN